MSVLLVVGPPRSGKSHIIDALTHGAFHREFYPHDINFHVKLARVQHHRVYEVQSIHWDGRPFGLVQYYASVADLILIVVNVTGGYEQLDQIAQLYETLDNPKQVAIIANYQAMGIRNQKLTNDLSLFAKINDLHLYELDSGDIYSVQIEFSHIQQSFAAFESIWQQNIQLVCNFIQSGIKHLTLAQ